MLLDLPIFLLHKQGKYFTFDFFHDLWFLSPVFLLRSLRLGIYFSLLRRIVCFLGRRYDIFEGLSLDLIFQWPHVPFLSLYSEYFCTCFLYSSMQSLWHGFKDDLHISIHYMTGRIASGLLLSVVFFLV